MYLYHFVSVQWLWFMFISRMVDNFKNSPHIFWELTALRSFVVLVTYNFIVNMVLSVICEKKDMVSVCCVKHLSLKKMKLYC